MAITDYFQGGYFTARGLTLSVPEFAEWAKRYPLRRVNVRRLAHCLSFARTDEPIGSVAFLARAQAADLAYPLLLLRVPKGLRIADGCHRTYRALIARRRYLPAYVVPVADLEQLATLPAALFA